MKIYNIDHVRENNYSTSGMDIMLMSKLFLLLEKKSNYKTLEDLNGLNIIVGENLKFNNIKDNEAIIFQEKIKKDTCIFAKQNIPFSLEKEKETFYAQINNGELVIRKDLMSLEQSCKAISTTHLTEEEKKAWSWLENGKTGISSLTMCHIMYPKLGHWLYQDLSYGYPRDNADFNRCLGFLETVPEAKKNLHQMSEVSEEWKKLVDKWEDITDLIKSDKRQEAYDLIKSCTTKIKPKI